MNPKELVALMRELRKDPKSEAKWTTFSNAIYTDFVKTRFVKTKAVVVKPSPKKANVKR